MNQNQKFKELQKTWYKKLKDEGFQDIEQDENYLHHPSTILFNNRVGGSEYEANRKSFYESKEEYYRVAGHFLHDNKFSSETERKIWELHSEGKSLRDIAIVLRDKKSKFNKDNIQLVVNRLTQEMLKKYIGGKDGQK